MFRHSPEDVQDDTCNWHVCREANSLIALKVTLALVAWLNQAKDNDSLGFRTSYTHVGFHRKLLTQQPAFSRCTCLDCSKVVAGSLNSDFDMTCAFNLWCVCLLDRSQNEEYIRGSPRFNLIDFWGGRECPALMHVRG